MTEADGTGEEGDTGRPTEPMREPQPVQTTVRAGDGTEVEVSTGATFGRFVTEEALGRGGMGVVIAARDPELNRRVAIKILHSGLWEGDEAEHRSRLQREAQAMAQLAHPNVVSVYEVGQTDNLSFIAMELVEGETLRRWQEQPRPWRQTLDMYIAAGRGLAAAHEAGLVHRDFKPENVLVGRDGRPRVTDFGLVASSGDAADVEVAGVGYNTPLTAGETVRGVALGTPLYMSPEHWDGTAIDARSDQFSFCTALWEALYGERPFGAASDGLRAAVRTGRIVPAPRRAGVPSRIESALRRGLHPDPRARWPSLTDLLDALLRHTAPRRTGAAAIAIGAAAVAIAGTSAVLVARSRTTADDASETDAGAFTAVAPAVNTVRDTRRLTLADSCEEYPEFSPDGATVYYDGQIGEDLRLFAVDVATGQTHELTHGAGWDLAPVPDPSGRRLAFLRVRDEPMSMFVADIDALEQPVLIGRSSLRPVWSPDGRYVWAGRSEHIRRVDPDTGEVSRTLPMLDDRIPLMGVELSDGGFVLLTNPGDGSAIADAVIFYPADGSPGRWLVRDLLEEVLMITADQTAVIIAKVTATRSIELWRVPLDGSAPTQVPGREIVARKKLSASRDGAHLVWSDCLERTRLAAFGSGTSARLTDLAVGDWSDAEPAAIPGTSEVLFLSDRADGLRVWRMDRNSLGPVRRVPFGDVEPVRLAVSPDGAHLAAAGNRTVGDRSHWGLFVAPLDGSRDPVRLADVEGELDPAFDRHGERIYFVGDDDGRKRIASVPTTGGDVQWVLPADTLAPAPSPTADMLAYLAISGDVRVPMFLDTVTNETRAIGPDLAGTWGHLLWSPDGRRLVLVERPSNLVEVDAATGTVVRRLSTGAEGIAGVTYVGDELIIGRTTWNGDLWTAALDAPLH